jgi:hypothetical protein
MKYTFTLEVQMEIPNKEEIAQLLQENQTVSDWIETEGNEVKQDIIALVEHAQNDTFLKHDYYLKSIVNIS